MKRGVTAHERIGELERTGAQLLARLGDLEKENAGLREENVRLRRELEEWKRGHRERSKRRSSRSEGKARGARKRPGRKAGHIGAFRKAPEPDRQVEHPTPTRCGCGGHVEATEETTMSASRPTGG